AKLSARKATAEPDRSALNALHPELDQLADRLLDLSQQDIDAYRAVIDARKSGAEDIPLERAYERAAEVPLAVATAAARALALAFCGGGENGQAIDAASGGAHLRSDLSGGWCARIHPLSGRLRHAD